MSARADAIHRARMPSLAALWHAPELIVARHALAGYLRSGWLWAEVAAVLVVYTVFFDYPGAVADIPYLCGFAARVLGALSAFGAAILLNRGMRANAYLSFARLGSRAPYLRGLLLATFALRLPLFVELFFLYIVKHHAFAPGISWLGQLLAGTLGLLAICLLLAALVFVLAPPIGSRGIQIVFLVWLVASLSSYAELGLIAGPLAIARPPLLPVVACLELSTTGLANVAGLLALVLVGAYTAGLLTLAEWLLARRDLLLH
jgi:hypothetical protein